MTDLIKAYGDRKNDGKIQVSFSLPVDSTGSNKERAREAARIFCQGLNMKDPMVVSVDSLGKGYSMFVAYGKTTISLDYDQIEAVSVNVEALSMEECDKFITKNLKRKIVVIGACTGFDAHTVGIDAILNMKGYNGEYGLERYKMFDVYNLGSQVLNAELIKKAHQLKADVLLISQVVTEKDIHILNLKDFILAFEKEEWEGDPPLILVGGPRISHALALELGLDAGFGAGTTPAMVATFVAKNIAERGGH